MSAAKHYPDPMREETRRIYGRLCPETNTRATRRIPPEPETRWERKRLHKALQRSQQEQIEYVYGRTGSVVQTMAETGCDYPTVRDAARRSA